MRLDNISFSYGRKQVIKNVSLELKRGEIIGLLGLNGTGKTTLIRLATKMVFPERGSIIFDGSVRALIEQPCFFNGLTGRDNLQYFLNRKVSDTELEHAPFLCASFIDEKVKKYSLGMKQKLALWMMLLFESDYVFLDEPFLSLDPNTVDEFIDLLAAEKEKRCVLISSHNIREIQRVTSRAIILSDGVIAREVVMGDSQKGLYRIKTIGDMLQSDMNDVSQCIFCGNNEILFQGNEEEVARLVQKIVSRGVGVCEVSLVKSYLESQFYECVNRGQKNET
ncbi:MAG: ATP-binding cassette domain-containing protein [Lachnospiraceae bacterium]|nr:ATP-binding cassette domain-containing protein [Lachnospiraceae bacterium]